MFGFTGIIGALITIQPDVMIWFRSILAATGILLYILYKKKPLKISRKHLIQLLLTGLIIAVHWIGFYGAIKVSNVSITLACFASSSFFAALLEPLFHKRPIDIKELLFGALVMAGISFIFKIESGHSFGIFLGLLAAFTSAIFTILNHKFVKSIDSSIISFYELMGAFIGISLYFIFVNPPSSNILEMSRSDWGYLLFLSIICTSLTFVAAVEIMKEISPYTVVLTVNLEPVYGIILAYFLLNEGDKISPSFYIAAAFILFIVFFNSYLKSKK